MSKPIGRIGKCKLIDVSVYTNLAPAEGWTVPCLVATDTDGDLIFHVFPEELIALGCDVDKDGVAFPFFLPEVVEVEE